MGSNRFFPLQICLQHWMHALHCFVFFCIRNWKKYHLKCKNLDLIYFHFHFCSNAFPPPPIGIICPLLCWKIMHFCLFDSTKEVARTTKNKWCAENASGICTVSGTQTCPKNLDKSCQDSFGPICVTLIPKKMICFLCEHCVWCDSWSNGMSVNWVIFYCFDGGRYCWIFRMCLYNLKLQQHEKRNHLLWNQCYLDVQSSYIGFGLLAGHILKGFLV